VRETNNSSSLSNVLDMMDSQDVIEEKMYEFGLNDNLQTGTASEIIEKFFGPNLS
jgi:hypothetical protein